MVEEHVYLQAKLGVTVGFGSSSSVNGSDEMLGCESLPLSHAHSIKDGALRFCHIAHEEETSHNRVCLIVNQHLRCRHVSIKVHRAHLISAVINLHMND